MSRDDDGVVDRYNRRFHDDNIDSKYEEVGENTLGGWSSDGGDGMANDVVDVDRGVAAEVAEGCDDGSSIQDVAASSMVTTSCCLDPQQLEIHTCCCCAGW